MEYYFSSSKNPLKCLKSHYFKKYLLFCTIMPISVMILFATMMYFSVIYAYLPVQRVNPRAIFDKDTKEYMKSMGLFEIVVKTTTFFFFIGAFIAHKRQQNELKRLSVEVIHRKLTNFQRYS